MSAHGSAPQQLNLLNAIIDKCGCDCFFSLLLHGARVAYGAPYNRSVVRGTRYTIQKLIR